MFTFHSSVNNVKKVFVFVLSVPIKKMLYFFVYKVVAGCLSTSLHLIKRTLLTLLTYKPDGIDAGNLHVRYSVHRHQHRIRDRDAYLCLPLPACLFQVPR